MQNLTNNTFFVSIILPCYNEKGNIILLINKIHSILQTHNYDHEIIVVDDNSPDGTFDVVKNKALPYVKAISRKETPSLGSSIKMGVENAIGNILVFMDSDFNHCPSQLPILISNINFFDCVTASRFVYGGKSYNQARFLMSWLFNIWSRIITRHFITDTLFGYLAIKREILDQLNSNDIFWGYGDYCIRLMYYLQNRKVKILQIPASHTPRVHGKGNTKFFKTFMQYSIETLRLCIKGDSPRV